MNQKDTEANRVFSLDIISVMRGGPGWDRIAISKCIKALRQYCPLDHINTDKFGETEWFIAFTQEQLAKTKED